MIITLHKVSDKSYVVLVSCSTGSFFEVPILLAFLGILLHYGYIYTVVTALLRAILPVSQQAVFNPYAAH